jgi:hypothetical protein
MTTEKNDQKILARIKAHPGLQERIEAILDIAENTSGKLVTADQAEGKAIEEIKKLSQELLKEWAVQQKAIETAKKTHPTAKNHEKKALLAIDIRKIEIVMKVANEMLRPFSLSAQVRCQSYFHHLQRAIVDFSADASFQDTQEGY